jgi:hypothetical protein
VRRVVSVSLGSSKRDHAFETEFLGETFRIERIGTDSDWDKAINMIKELDGKIDCFGMGGIDLYLYSPSGRRLTIRDAKRLLVNKQTPMVDGGGLKTTLEYRCIHQIQDQGVVDFRGKKVLMVCGIDRLGMARAFDEVGAKLTLGDLIYTVGINLPMHSLKSLNMVATLVGPIVASLPFEMIYPNEDDKPNKVIKPKHAQYYYDADVIAGDFKFINKYLPPRIDGKIIVTNTTTKDDVKYLKERGASLLITTTPDMEGRSFGTNVIEALLVSVIGKKPDDIKPEDYFECLDRLNLQPGVVKLN